MLLKLEATLQHLLKVALSCLLAFIYKACVHVQSIYGLKLHQLSELVGGASGHGASRHKIAGRTYTFN